MEIKSKLSTMWIVILINMIFADIFSIMIEITNGGAIDIIGDDAKVTMAIAAIITNIPILMIYFSRVLKYKINRILNIAAAAFTILYVCAGSLMPHYIIIAAIEIVFLIMIIKTALQWRSANA